MNLAPPLVRASSIPSSANRSTTSSRTNPRLKKRSKRKRCGVSLPLCANSVYGQAVRDWLGRVQVKTLYIEPGSPWENGYIESFNGRLRDELLNARF